MPVRSVIGLCAVCLLLGAAVLQAEDTGQYRSRIQLDPLGEMSKGSEISIDELEQQINAIEDPYAKSSAGRHLARHYVQQKDYPAAIDYYRQALASQGLSEVANREMLRELAQVYLLNENYRQAAEALESALQIDLVPEAGDYLLLAQARYRLADYVGVVEALDEIQAAGLRLEIQQMRQALALYYRAAAYEQSGDILRQLLVIEPDNAQNWHQLASVYLQQNKRRAALDHLMLALEKGVPFTSAELLLLIDLQAANGNPYGAAQILQNALQWEMLESNATNHRKLFELWFQAREREQATLALQQAARLSGDTELYLYLAQLQVDEEQWPAVQQTVLAACSNQLQDKYVSRANLLLGVSQLKQGNRVGARQAFINATLVGGAHVQAGQWLGFMEAQPPTEDEVRWVVGPCYGSVGKRAKLQIAATPSAAEVDDASVKISVEEQQTVTVQVKAEPAKRFFYSTFDESLAELAPRLKSLAVRLNIVLVKAGGKADGPLHILSEGISDSGKLRMALPVRGAPQARGRYRIAKSGEFKCAWQVVEVGEEGLLSTAREFSESVVAAGHELTGERRLLLLGPANDGIEVELQLGIH